MIFPEIKIIQNSSFQDNRGELWTIWEDSKFTPNLKFNHDKVSISKKNVLRGLHSDSKSWKLITCLHGQFQLAIVDFRKDSTNFLKSDTLIMNASDRICVLVPPMFANGHLVLSESTVFYYKWCYEGTYPDVKDQISLNWSDPIFKINWLCENPIISERDKKAPYFSL